MCLILLAGVGIYNAVRHDMTVFGAVSPVHAVLFFARNGFTGWRMLGGILLCVTGTEALFADLGHFNVTAIQVGDERLDQILVCSVTRSSLLLILALLQNLYSILPVSATMLPACVPV